MSLFSRLFTMLWCVSTVGLCTIASAQTASVSVPIAPSSATYGNKPLLFKHGTVTGGLSVSLSVAGIPDSVALTLVRELSQAFNVEEDIATGDRFVVLFEAPLLARANSASGQKLMAFEYTHQGKTYAAYWFDVSDATGDEGYFLADGSSLRPAFLRTPIEIVRVTSGFGARKVPKRKKWRNHDGVDFGAPIGTQIFAAADGVIEVQRSEKGFGKVVKIAHAKGAQTIYGHMSAFVAGLGVGSAVKQGDVIGYVGRTGWATGPHLHYEYRVDNKPIDPFSNDFPTSQRVTEVRMPMFSEHVATLRAQFGLMQRTPEPAPSPSPTAAAQTVVDTPKKSNEGAQNISDTTQSIAQPTVQAPSQPTNESKP